MSKTTALSILISETQPEQVETLLRAYGAMEDVHQRLKLLSQAAQGACLTRLRELHGHLKGGGVTSTRCGGASWELTVKDKFGFSDEKARRLINRWKAVATIMDGKKITPAERMLVADFLRRPMLHLTAPEVAALEKVTHKIASVQEEIAALEECKYLKAERGAGLLKDHDKSKKGTDDDEPVAPSVLFQMQLMLPIAGGGDGTTKTIFEQFDDLYEAWSKPTKLGAKTVPLWQYGKKAEIQQLVQHLETGRAAINAKLDTQIAQMREALSK